MEGHETPRRILSTRISPREDDFFSMYPDIPDVDPSFVEDMKRIEAVLWNQRDSDAKLPPPRDSIDDANEVAARQQLLHACAIVQSMNG